MANPATRASANSTREPGRRGKQGETRARIVDAAIELIRLEGPAALTTSRLTRAVGIAQPGFYAHFKNVDELMGVAIGQVVDELRRRQSEARRRAFVHFRTAADLSNVAAVRAAWADTLDVFLSDPTFSELFLRYRRDSSALGQQMAAVLAEVREELTEDLWSNARRMGYRPEHYPNVAIFAEHILGLYLGAAEALLDGRFDSRDLVIDSLSRNTYALLVANARWAGITK